MPCCRDESLNTYPPTPDTPTPYTHQKIVKGLYNCTEGNMARGTVGHLLGGVTSELLVNVDSRV